MQFQLTVERTDDGLWSITSPELYGLLTVGQTLSEALESVHEAGRAIVTSYEKEAPTTPSAKAQKRIFEAVFVV